MPRYKQNKTKIKLPDGYNKRQRVAIASEVIDFMIERTLKNKDKDNKSMGGYSKGYKNSLDFKIAKLGETKVNLTLSEEMLNSMKLVSQRKGEIDVGFDGRKNRLNGKVEGNRKGTYGNKKPVTKKRDFLGITKKDLDNILQRFPLDDRQRLLEQILEIELAREAAEEILGFKGDDN